ncbi:pyridoxal phosphate phosphatase PHOSPHO2-like [Achroia grisella]|uniref:pyridoxal phosphate phosphatase PHOSPHO2-like n=1 Tax=Achroia grisella TaxID=688607 RepID=UPI0027D2E578|nr:pyridoxal phosphate phosphatase PHOSPHO2-like [Achroia grisella]
MSSLAVFDFDRTVVDDDSDATIINRLREKEPPPEWEASNHDWTPYMSEVFEHAYSAGLQQGEILDCIGSMRPTPGVEELITTLAAEGWDVLLLTDANSVFVNHWLKVHGLQDAVTNVITNSAFWRDGRLFIEPCMRQTACARCPSNLCKSIALAQWLAQRPPYTRVTYAGDGRNDYCPATNLPAHAIVFPRSGYPLDDLTKQTLATTSPQVKAKVVPWEDCYTILHEVFPHKRRISA